MATDYTVTGQRYTTAINKQGKVTPVVEVTFETLPEGTVGKVDVPQQGYSKATAQPLIEAQVAALKEVSTL